MLTLWPAAFWLVPIVLAVLILLRLYRTRRKEIVTGSLLLWRRLAKQQPKVKRYDVAGRKVIIYIEDMMPNDQLGFSFEARALYPVRAQAVASQAYSYYRPEWKGESLGGAVVVKAQEVPIWVVSAIPGRLP